MTTPLHAYRHAHVVVQNVHTSAVDAALAMRTNAVGCVLVSDGREVVGIATDRDLALRVVATGLSPRDTELGAIMSAPILALDAGASLDAAVALMREKRIRRVPLLEGKRVVGMVALDDLILERSATFDQIHGVVRAQVVQAGPARTRPFDEWTSLARRHARAVGTKAKLLTTIKERAGLRSNEQAEVAAEIVLEALVTSVERPLAHELIDRLPVAFRPRLRDLSAADDGKNGSRSRCVAEIARALEVDREYAREVVDAVGAALAPILVASDPIGRRLPRDMRAILGEPLRPSQSRRFPASSRRSRRPSRHP